MAWKAVQELQFGQVPPFRNQRRWAYALVTVCVLGYLALDAIAQVLPPHYSALGQPESDLAVGPFGYLMTANFLNRGLLTMVFLYATEGELRPTHSAGGGRSSGSWFLGVFGVGSLLLAAFPTDVPPTPVTWHGLIHLVVATLAFLCGSVGVVLLSRRLAQEQRLRGVGRFAQPISLLAVVSFLALVAIPSSPQLNAAIGGLVERVVIGSIVGWMLAMSLYLGFRKGREP